MKNTVTPCALPELTADFLRSRSCLVDNLFADLGKQIGMNALLKLCSFHKRSGISVNEVMYCLTLWVWLKENSVSMFARESLKTFCSGGKDILYEAMNREDWNWRGLNFNIGYKAVRQMYESNTPKAFVLDDSIKIRHGKKMPGVSSHLDHTTGRHVMGQQVLTPGLSCAEALYPIR